MFNLGNLKPHKVASQNKPMQAKYENKNLEKGSAFGAKPGKSMPLPKGNPAINK